MILFTDDEIRNLLQTEHGRKLFKTVFSAVVEFEAQELQIVLVGETSPIDAKIRNEINTLADIIAGIATETERIH